MARQPLVLIVDDEQDFLDIFATKLSSVGLKIETASSGDDGITKARKLKPDLILMDVKMPGLTGADALLKLKDDSATKDIRVVFLTSLGDPRDLAEDVSNTNSRFSREFGAAGFIRKTDDLDTLAEKVKAFLNIK